MRTKISLYCDNCGGLTFVGYEYFYEYPPNSGNLKSDVEGDYFNGAGKCDVCGKTLCETCGGFSGKVCRNCIDKD